MPSEKVWIKLLHKWGEYAPGDEAEFDRSKANTLIAAGTAVKIRKSKRKIRRAPPAETATAPPAPETADTPPRSVRPMHLGPTTADTTERKVGEGTSEATDSEPDTPTGE